MCKAAPQARAAEADRDDCGLIACLLRISPNQTPGRDSLPQGFRDGLRRVGEFRGCRSLLPANVARDTKGERIFSLSALGLSKAFEVVEPW